MPPGGHRATQTLPCSLPLLELACLLCFFVCCRIMPSSAASFLIRHQQATPSGCWHCQSLWTPRSGRCGGCFCFFPDWAVWAGFRGVQVPGFRVQGLGLRAELPVGGAAAIKMVISVPPPLAVLPQVLLACCCDLPVCRGGSSGPVPVPCC